MSDKKQTFTTKLHECTAKDSLRPMLQCVHFLNGFAYASNSYVCIKQSLEYHNIVEPENLDGEALHRDSYAAAMKFDYVLATPDGLDCSSVNGQKAFYEYYRPENIDTGEDSLEKVGRNRIPDFERVLNPARGVTSMSFIGVNPDHFTTLMKALHAPAKTVRIQFTGIETAILVDVVGVEDQNAVIMPKMLDGTIDFPKE